MKRFLTITIVALLALFSISALSYKPALNFSMGVRGSKLEEWYLHTSTLVTLETELPTISFDYGGRLSLPIGLTLNSRSAEYDDVSIHGYIEGFIGIAYEQEITDRFSISTALKGLYRYYETIDSSLIGGSIDLGFIFMPHPNMGIMVPIELSMLKGEMDFTISIASRFLFGGSK